MSFTQRLPALYLRVFGPEIEVIQDLCAAPTPADALLDALERWERERERWRASYEALTDAVQDADPATTKALLAAWLRRHSHPGRLPGDLLALRRNLGLSAIQERVQAREDRLGVLTELGLVALLDAVESDPERWDATADATLRVLHTHPRPPTRRRAAACLAELVRWGHRSVPIVQALLRASCTGDVWTRRQAVAVFASLEPPQQAALVRRLRDEPSDDAPLVRARLMELARDTGEADLLETSLRDPAEIVRFTAIDGLLALRLYPPLRALVQHPEPRTRAYLAARLAGTDGPNALLEALCRDPDPSVQRFALLTAAARARHGPSSPGIVEAAQRARHSEVLPVRRAAEAVLVWEAHHASPARTSVEPLTRLAEGESRTVRLPPGVEPIDLAVALRPWALDGFGFTLRPVRRGVRVVRGDRLVPAGWRILHELRHPAPAKRQGHTHAVAPALDGPIHVPPLGLAEQSATGVPGQRVQVRDEDWGPHLPMVDDYRRALTWGQAWVVSSSGITTITPPTGLLHRVWARTTLLWRYGTLHQERLAALEQGDETRFTAHLERMGFQHGFRARSTAWLPYLLSTSGNTLLHLALLLALLWSLLLGAQIAVRTRIRMQRRRIGLVIGGWGTRGKSGTERVKAGMLAGAGVPFVSKTTGCEAMLLHRPAGGEVHELFLFRPYDKATIWEQAEVVRFAARAGARALLWECMALNPRYVDILQRGWMRDDLSTLTNAYPDHEDVMGPSGMEVAQVIGSFAPPGATLFTAESNMLPVLREEAARFGSAIVPLQPVEKELIPTELLERLPYAEHPSNVALAARVGRELGLHPVEAIGWMAEHVVPDLGALMVFPEANIDGRFVTFVNGHSANDELSFLHGWKHTGFAAHRTTRNPERWLVGVVNNRADRLPRSRVFARLVVRSAGAHRFLLIGTNLSGFLGFVDEAIEELLHGLDLAAPSAWERWSEHLKIPDPRGWIFYVLRARGVDPDPLLDTFEALRPTADPAEAEARAASLDLELVQRAAPEILPWIVPETAAWLRLRGAESPAERSALLRERLRARIHTLPDPGASGDTVVAAAAALAPPGLPVRMMGMQNIKGTGLDFVYQWVRWRTLHADLQHLDGEAMRGFDVARLTAVFHCDAVLEALPAGAPLRRAVEARRAELLEARRRRPTGSTLGRTLRRWAWRAYDPVDALFRRRRARQIFADLAMERISHDEAARLLAQLTYRQKPV